jgi:uncharacterized delta-60 repeat protein
MNPKLSNKYALLSYCTILLVLTASAAGQAGHLDPTFGHAGIATQQTVVTQLTNLYSAGAIAIQSDGKIVVAAGIPGSNSFTVPALLRFLSNGNLDASFGANGVAVLPNSFGAYGAVAIQLDGKILAGTSAGGTNSEVDRFTATGHLDSSFGTQGRVSFRFSTFSGLALQPDGRILVSVQSFVGRGNQVSRLLSNGSTDTSFGTNGTAFPPGGSGPLEVLTNGDILVFGGLVSRLTSSGAPDTQFGVDAQLLAQNSGHASAADGDILVAGTLVHNSTVPSQGLAAFSYLSVGIGDPSFGKNGGVSTPFAGFPTITAAGMGLESNGDIVELGTLANGSLGAFGLVRYTPLGQLDTSFGSGGTVTTSFGNNTTTIASAIAIQSDDKIVVAGTVTTVLLHGQFNTALVVARYLK